MYRCGRIHGNRMARRGSGDLMQLRLTIAESRSEFATHYSEWNDLWLRSKVELPTVRFEHVDHWFREFNPARVRIVLVYAGPKLILGLPLAGAARRVSLVGSLTNNTSTMTGELLLDEQHDCADAACGLLADALQRLPWALLELRGIALDSTRWRRVKRVLDQQRIVWSEEHLWDVGLIAFPETYDEYRAGWSKNHKRHMKRAARALDAVDSNARVDYLTTDISPPIIREAFEIEHRSWKGEEGTSIMSSTRTTRYYEEEARLLAANDQLALAFLVVNGERIAFEYLYRSGHTVFVPKVSYDRQHHHLSPGQVLRLKLYEQWYGGGLPHLVNYLGPLVQATDRWTTDSYRAGRLSVPCRAKSGHALLKSRARLRRDKKAFAKVLERLETRSRDQWWESLVRWPLRAR